jgi:hypothetical protein
MRENEQKNNRIVKTSSIETTQIKVTNRHSLPDYFTEPKNNYRNYNSLLNHSLELKTTTLPMIGTGQNNEIR